VFTTTLGSANSVTDETFKTTSARYVRMLLARSGSRKSAQTGRRKAGRANRHPTRHTGRVFMFTFMVLKDDPRAFPQVRQEFTFPVRPYPRQRNEFPMIKHARFAFLMPAIALDQLLLVVSVVFDHGKFISLCQWIWTDRKWNFLAGPAGRRGVNLENHERNNEYPAGVSGWVSVGAPRLAPPRAVPNLRDPLRAIHAHITSPRLS